MRKRFIFSRCKKKTLNEKKGKMYAKKCSFIKILQGIKKESEKIAAAPAKHANKKPTTPWQQYSTQQWLILGHRHTDTLSHTNARAS